MRGKILKGRTLILLAATIVASCGMDVALSWPTFAQASGQQVHNFDIAAKPIRQAMNDIVRATGIDVVFPETPAASKTGQPVHGSMTTAQAVSTLLAGSGLQFSFINANTVTIIAPTELGGTGNSTGTTVLAPITVQGETALGPVGGYVAQRSATGTKTDTPLVETPRTVSVVSRKQLDDQGVKSVGEALRYTSGVVAEEYGGADTRLDRFMVRGFSSSYPFLDGLTTTTRYTLMSPKIETYALERVEVVGGPGSSLYGQGTPGGVVSLVSKRPTDTPLHEVQLQVFDPKGVGTAFDFSGPIAGHDDLLYRLTGVLRRADTQVDGVDTRNYFLAPALTVKPDEDTTFTLLGKLQRTQDGILSQNLPALGTLYSASFGKIPTSLFVGEPDFNSVNRSSASIGYAFEHHFDEVWTVRQNLRYTHSNTDIQQIGTYGYVSGTTSLNRWSLAADAKLNDFAVDNQVEAKFDTGSLEHTALVGLDYSRSHTVWKEWDGSASSLDVLHPVYGLGVTLPTDMSFATNDTLAQTGLYAQDQIALGNWRLSGGLRYDWADTTSDDMLTGSSTRLDDKALTGHIGLLYHFDNGIAPFVSYATSFAPTLSSYTTYDGSPLKPTEGEQYEIGIKYQPDGTALLASLSAFDITQTNVLTLDTAHLGTGHYYGIQTGEVQMRGIEASLKADLGHGFNLLANYSFTDGEITKDNTGNIGNQPKNVPRNMASLWVDKTFDEGPLAGFGVGVGGRYVGQRYGDDANTLKLDGQMLADAALHYTYKNARLALNVTNLFDKAYVGTCENEAYCYYGQRRTVMGTWTVKW